MRKSVIIAVLLILLCAVCTCAHAAESVEYNGDSFVISNGELSEWTDGGEPTTYLEIPASWEITEIAENVFQKSQSLTEVVIPEGVTKIGEAAFYLSQNLKKISFPSSLEWIGAHAMSYTGIEEATIPASVEMIGNQCFGSCSQLKAVYFAPECKLDYFLSCIFTDCSSLERVILPENFHSMDIWAFHNCDKLNDIVLPAGMTYLHDDVFSKAEGVCISVYKDSLAHQHCVKNGIPYRLVSDAKVLSVNVKNTYASTTNGKAVYELEVVTTKDTYALAIYDDELGYQTTYSAGMVGSTTVNGDERTWRIARALSRDGERRFILRPYDENNSVGADKHFLIHLTGAGMITTEIKADKSVIKPGENMNVTVCTFEGARYLYVYAENGNEIATFYYSNHSTASNGIREWTVPLAANYFSGMGEFGFTFKANAGSGTAFGNDVWGRVQVTADMILPDDLITIETEAFKGIDAVSVIIPDGTQRIGEKAFANSSKLAYVYIPESVSYIEPDAFANCSYPLFIYGEDESNAEYFAVNVGYVFKVNGQPEGAAG